MAQPSRCYGEFVGVVLWGSKGWDWVDNEIVWDLEENIGLVKMTQRQWDEHYLPPIGLRESIKHAAVGTVSSVLGAKVEVCQTLELQVSCRKFPDAGAHFSTTLEGNGDEYIL